MAPVRDSVIDQQVDNDLAGLACIVADLFPDPARPRSVTRDPFRAKPAYRSWSR
jgi:hypothetical protein